MKIILSADCLPQIVFVIFLTFRGAEGFHNKIFLNEDLTRLRARLFHMVRKSGKVTRASTKNGRIYCNIPCKEHPVTHQMICAA